MNSIEIPKFKTKKQQEEYTRDLLSSLGCCIITKDSKYFNFFIFLINNHPDKDLKIGLGIENFRIMKNPLNFKCYQTCIIRIDGSEEIFSWRYSIKNKDKEDPKEIINCYNYDLNSALRSSISDQILKFKNSNIMCCNICKKKDKIIDFHVDHIVPFSKIKEDFLKNNKAPLEFDKDDKLSYRKFKQTDELFELEWRLHHLENASYQILCRDCNIKKSNK
jgi:hypothetical protein